jgi:hypothetical protein
MIASFAFSRARRSRPLALTLGAALLLGADACSNPVEPIPTRSVEIGFSGAVSARADLPASAQDCAAGVLVTRVHPSWRNYVAVPMAARTPPPLDTGWTLTFPDVPVGVSVKFRINDKNWCDQNPTGAVLRDVIANGVVLTQNTTTPGPAGEQPGFAFTVDASGQVRQ